LHGVINGRKSFPEETEQMKRLYLALTIAGLMATAPAYAQNINATQAKQQARINAGIADGTLSAKEAERLNKKAARIAELEAKLRASNGKLTSKERSKLANELSKLNNEISRQRKDGNNYSGYKHGYGNPPGPVGGPGAGKNWNYNPPGAAGGPGQGWQYNGKGKGKGRWMKNHHYNPPGKAGGPGRGWEHN